MWYQLTRFWKNTLEKEELAETKIKRAGKA